MFEVRDSEENEELGIMYIPLEPLLKLWDPMLDNLWGCGKISEEDVWSCVDYALTPANESNFSSYERNVARIAYFLHHGWESADVDRHPVSIDLGFDGYTPNDLVYDGNHRLAAAKLRGDTHILASISGSWEKATQFFKHGVHPDDFQ